MLIGLIRLERRMGTGGMGEEFPKEAGSVLVLKGPEAAGPKEAPPVLP